MAQRSVVSQWLQRVLAPYPSSDIIRTEVLDVIHRYPTLNPKTEVYTYDTGHTNLLLQLYGTIPISYRSATYHIPITVWFPLEYPRRAPMVYVSPTKDMGVRKSKEVEPGGRVGGEVLEGWERKWQAQTIINLLESLQSLFSIQPPVYSKTSSNSNSTTSTTVAPATLSSSPSHSPAPRAPASPAAFTTATSFARQAMDGEQLPPPPPARPRSMMGAEGFGSVNMGGSIRHDSLPVYSSTSQSSYQPPRPNPPPHFSQPPPHPPPLPVSPIRTSRFSSPPPPPPVPPHPQTMSGVGGPHPNGAVRVPPPPWEAQNSPVPVYGQSSYQQPQQPPPISEQPPPTVSAPRPQPRQPPAPPKPDLMSDLLDDSTQSGRSTPPIKPLPPSTLHLHSLLLSHISSRLPQLQTHLQSTTQQLLSIQSDLTSGEPAIRDEMARLVAVRDVCASVVERMSSVVGETEKRVADVKGRGEVEVDQVVCGISIVHNQLIDLVAEDNAIEDTIYHLARALDKERIDLDRFLKQIRILAREQYQKRAMIERIQNMMAGNA